LEQQVQLRGKSRRGLTILSWASARDSSDGYMSQLFSGANFPKRVKTSEKVKNEENKK
jgi:hypothetical protein